MTDCKAKSIGKVEDLGEIYQVDAPLHKQISAFEDVGINYPYLVTPEETCMIRIAGLSNDWTRTCMAPIGAKDETPIIYKFSPLMNILMAEFAVNSHACRKYPMFNREFYNLAKELAKQDSVKEPEDRRAFVLSSKDDYNLTPEMKDTRAILGKPTQEYFKKFTHKIIQLWNLPTNSIPKDKCVINYLWFSGPDDGSQFSCRDRNLDNEDWAFGVLRKSGEATSQKFGHSLTDIKNAIVQATPKTLESLGIPAISNMILDPLEQNILQTLRNQ